MKVETKLQLSMKTQMQLQILMTIKIETKTKAKIASVLKGPTNCIQETQHVIFIFWSRHLRVIKYAYVTRF